MTLLSDLLATVFDRKDRLYLSEPACDRPLVELAQELVGAKGDASGRTIAAEILTRYDDLSDAEKLRFFQSIAETMNIDPDRVRATLDAYEAKADRKTYRVFSAAAEPTRQELIRRLHRLPGATKALVRMRADLLRLARNDDELQAFDLDFRHLFSSWFNLGFLVLRPINWDSPAQILEKIIAYEAVHEIHSWDDLRRRLEPEDRRCFAFFHPAMPDEPLIFVEVALTKGIASSVQTLLAEERQQLSEEQADTAVFYSISNCQAGLANISFGSSLIKQVAADLRAAHPQLTTFVTLSPIPKLAAWAEQSGVTLPSDSPQELCASVAEYLLNAKRKDGSPFDPVARFHLGNGAELHAIHAGADLSAKGLAQSSGAMVNYLYDLGRATQNHEQFAATQQVLASAEVKSLVQAAPKKAIGKKSHGQPTV